MISCHRLRMKTDDGEIMRQKATTLISAHGQMPAGRLKALISTGNKRDWFEYDIEGQCVVGVAAVRVG